MCKEWRLPFGRYVLPAVQMLSRPGTRDDPPRQGSSQRLGTAGVAEDECTRTFSRVALGIIGARMAHAIEAKRGDAGLNK